MDYSEFRRFGYVSRLSEIRCSGPSTQAVSNTSNEQTALAQQEQAQSTANQAQSLALEQPLISKETALATGDRSQALAASMPTISTITGGFNASKEQIMNSVPAGPARDAALANLQTSRATSTANTEAGMIEGAPSTLANVGQGIGAFSIQQLGAALSGYSGASQGEQSVMNVQQQQQDAKLGVAGSALGMGGEIASAGIKASDRRSKQGVSPIRPTLDLIDQFGVYEFEYIKEPGRRYVGVMAQEVMGLLPELISERNGRYMVDYAQLAAVAIASIKELTDRVKVLEAQIEECSGAHRA